MKAGLELLMLLSLPPETGIVGEHHGTQLPLFILTRRNRLMMAWLFVANLPFSC